MKLYVDLSSADLAAALMQRVNRSTRFRMPDFVLADTPTIEIYLCDGEGAYDASSGASGYSLRAGVGLPGGPLTAFQETWTPISNGWRGELNLGTNEFKALVGNARAVAGFFEIEVTNPDGRERTVAQVPVTLRNAVVDESTLAPVELPNYLTADEIADQYVAKAGDTMTGPLVLADDPTEDLQAATKQYVDSMTSGAGAGSVTSVGLELPDIFDVTGSPITGAGTLAASLVEQEASLFLAGPLSGSAATPTFRTIAESDIPELLQSKITGLTSDLAALNDGLSALNDSLALKLDLAGGTLTGALTLAADPATALGAATKQYVDAAVGGAVPSTTDDLTEGATNLYWTNARFDGRLALKTTDNLTEGAANLYYTTTRFDTRLATKTTDNLTEGSTNLYYTAARFDTRLATKTTDNLTEGSTNLYFTDARARAALSASSPLSYNSGTGAFSIQGASGSQNGYLSSTDWTTFNNKVGTSRSISTTAPLSGGGDLSANRTLSIPAATGSVDGYLTSADWTTFNSKVGTSRSISTTAPLSGGGDLSANRTLSIPAATGSVDGYLTAADWTAFNGKQAALGYTPLNKAGDTMTGNLLFSATNTFDIGDATHLPKSVYAGTSFIAPDGSAANPSIRFSSVAHGLYVDSATILGIVVAGVERGLLNSSGQLTLVTSSGNIAIGGGTPSISVYSSGLIGWSDLFLGREGAATLQLGQDAASPTAQTLKGADARAGTDTNTAGGDLTVAAGRPTGNATPGSLYLSTSSVGSSGTAASALVQRLKIDGNGLTTSILNGIGSTVTDSLQLSNTTAAAAGAQQYSPALRLTGQGWGTTAGTSQACDWRIYSKPVQNAVPTGQFLFDFSVAGGAFTNVFLISSSGNITAGGSINGTDFNLGSTNALTFGSRSKMQSSANGVIELFNNAGNDFTRLNFGGTTSSCPALTRSSASLICKLADNSANAAFEALSFKTSAPSGGTSQPWKLGSVVSAAVTADTTRYLEVDVNGTSYKIILST